MWRKILRTNFTNCERLADFLELSPDQKIEVLQNPRFILNLPLRLAEKIKKGTLDDPILRQFLPIKLETHTNPLFISDPVRDTSCRIEPKLLHKYQGRVLIVTTSACAMHCRYCFRQNFDYDVNGKSYDNELHVIAKDSSITEVILSGGDPLSLSDSSLEKLLKGIAAIPHIERIRFHTRFPIGIPERIDESLLNILKNVRCQLWFIIHSNHPLELDEEVLARLRLLQNHGIPILNQAVLLHKVNDDVTTLKALFEKLINNGIMPYYLHQLDRVQGAMHFEVTEDKGRQLIEELMRVLPGYAIPKYVREIAGEPSKTPL